MGNLSDEQAKPVFSDCRLNVCMAVPGSGKTKVAVERIRRLREETGDRILAVTFSNKAAKELQKRLGKEDAAVRICTIHSLCMGIVREHWGELGRLLGSDRWPAQPRVAESRDEMKLIKEMFPRESPRKLLDRFETLRKLGCEPDVAVSMLTGGAFIPKVSLEAAKFWAEYEQVRLSRGVLTYDDMVRMAEALMPLPHVSASLCSRWGHVLVDEAQDTSHTQWKVLRPIVTSAKTTLVVGDSNQSIYGWRDADGGVLKGVSRLEGAVLFRLTKSWRSCGKIAAIANRIIGDPTSQIVTEREDGHLTVLKFKCIQEEVREVIHKLGLSDEAQPKRKLAILARTNSYLEPFERELIKRKIPYSGSAFYRSDHIQALAEFLQRVTTDPELAVERGFIQNEGYSPVERQDFKQALETLKQEGLGRFLELAAADELPGAQVSLATGHSSKGLEYDVVYAVGVQQGVFPHKLALDVEEERRLLYVVLTRARDELHISYVGDPSPFLPEDLL